MQENFGDDNKELPGVGYPPQEAAGYTGESKVMPGGNIRGAPAGAPAERIDAPVPEKIVTAPRKPAFQNLERNFASRSDEWREPSYRQTYETTSDMYTPGIYANPQYPRKRGTETEPGVKERGSGSWAGRFVRVACLVLVCAILSGAATYGVMEYRFNRGDFTVVNQVVLGGSTDIQQSNGISSPVSSGGAGMSAEDIYTMACTQVVSITTKAGNLGGMFGSMIPSTATAVAGSGFIISSDGYILTNYHVVETSYINDLPLSVFLINGIEYQAKVIGYDIDNDVALVKIDATGLNPAVIANSDLINVGQTVYAVGNPFGELVYTMTEGIVSARDREVSVEGKTINTFQLSAAVNSGNSGGPVYDTNGEVIGIVTAKPMANSVEGIGFAIPINDAIEIAAELIEFGYITGRPLLGITAQTVSSAHAEYWGWVVGTRVMSVLEGSAAEKAGIIVGDIIIGLGDTNIDSMDTLKFALRKYKAGDTEKLTVWRNGDEVELTITFDEDLSAGQVRSLQTVAQDEAQDTDPQATVPPDRIPIEKDPSEKEPHFILPSIIEPSEKTPVPSEEGQQEEEAQKSDIQEFPTP